MNVGQPKLSNYVNKGAAYSILSLNKSVGSDCDLQLTVYV